MIPPTLTTERLIIRPARREDAGPVAAMWVDPDVVRFIGFTRTPQDAWFALARTRGMWPLLGYGYWVVTDRESGEFLGEAGFADFRRGMAPDLSQWPEAGWAFARHAWGRGIASEAIGAMHDWLDVHRPGMSVCIIDPAHKASLRVAEKTGYEFWEASRYGDVPVHVFRRNSPAPA